jgi:hypothetical protein
VNLDTLAEQTERAWQKFQRSDTGGGAVSRFQKATAAWDREVDEVAASLVEGGMVPFEAMIKATQIVRERRQQRKRSPVASPEREPSNG